MRDNLRRFVVSIVLANAAQVVAGFHVRRGPPVDHRGLARRQSQSCQISSDCTNTVPSNANRYCASGRCSWRCRSGFTSTGSSCVAASAGQTCSVSSDCNQAVPANANQCVPALSSVFSAELTFLSPTSARRLLQLLQQGHLLIPLQNGLHARRLKLRHFRLDRHGAVQHCHLYGRLTRRMGCYVDKTYAFANNLASVTNDGTILLSIDRSSNLASGDYRPSVRLQAYDTYDVGHLMIFDIKHVPVGCSVWPAMWIQRPMLAPSPFRLFAAQLTHSSPAPVGPDLGEIDVYEGVNNRAFNQMTLHTTQGCTRNPNIAQTGGVVDWDPKSYGTGFNAAGGGVWAVLFAETGTDLYRRRSISMWRWTRSAIPSDIKNGAPRSSQWGTPVAAWDSSTCDIKSLIKQQIITFDITTCGDWAAVQSVWQDPLQSGSSCYPKYANCAAAMRDRANFAEAYFEINSIQIYSL
ncbi:hypothetical protein JCM10213_009171 [Rhodosporidiobolus nylandii]